MLLERNEQLLVERYIKPDAVVLELGARYGTVSCAINKKLSNPRNQVSVEPDSRVWNSLKVNKALNKCDFSILCGAISRKPIAMADVNSFEGYGARTVVTEKSSIDTLTLEEVERKYSLRFTTLVADCEGFLEQFMDENPRLYDTLDMIFFEKDSPATCNYAKIIAALQAAGFKNLVSGFHDVWKK
jgi:FkbM family methyltransferase